MEIRTDKDTDNAQLWQKEENDLMSSVASLVSNHSSPTGWVPAAEVHAEVCYAKLLIFVQFLEF